MTTTPASTVRAEGKGVGVWWPAGVVITLAHAPRSAIDTVGGTAVALVADGRKTAPETGIRAWEKKCG